MPSISIGINYVDDLNKQRALLDATLFSLGEENPDQVAAAAVATALGLESILGAAPGEYGETEADTETETETEADTGTESDSSTYTEEPEEQRRPTGSERNEL